ncbi:MAG: hypothetical protein JNJ46_01565 [Myxococcales bacterium]|nr:hypothetical protein [Myxococcales bacterium]
MAFFTVDNVVVGSGASPSAPARVSEWSSTGQYSDGAIVVFNGSQYIANGTPTVGVQPPIEVASPVVAGSPKWTLAARGRSRAVAYDDAATYFADQVVTYLGGTYILDAPTVPQGTKPSRDKRWTRLSETLTDSESAKVHTGDLINVPVNVTVQIFKHNDEESRVRHHWVRFSTAFFVGSLSIYTLRFPRPIKSEARPAITFHTLDGATAAANLTATYNLSGNEITGYTATINAGIAPGTYEWLVTVKQAIDEV